MVFQGVVGYVFRSYVCVFFSLGGGVCEKGFHKLLVCPPFSSIKSKICGRRNLRKQERPLQLCYPVLF